jgi:23S rRNA (uracil1939-C5)-methyltransferase
MAQQQEPNLWILAKVMTSSLSGTELVIDHLNPSGEGVIRGIDGTIFVPMALPGETVVLGENRQIADIINPSTDRATPFCPEFGRCGGCAMQHMHVDAYGQWKRETVRRALERDGFTARVAPTLIVHGKGRRRAVVHVRFGPKGPVAGFMEAKTHNLLPLEACPVLMPELQDIFKVARAVTTPLSGRGKPLDVQVTVTMNGLDVDIRGHGIPDTKERQRLTDVATFLDLARLSVHRDIIVERKTPTILVGDIPVILPARAFLQATDAAEDTLAQLVVAGVGKAKSVADLFCGVGPFALRLAKTARVYAADDGKEAIAALERAVRSRQGLKPVTAEVRDLFRRPLLPMELAPFDVVVMDPPRAGAEAQSRQITASKVKKVVSVSCDLQSFLRDARILAAGGFTLEGVTPVDQFAWSKHIELVGIFNR